jgi:hypothetical protein
MSSFHVCGVSPGCATVEIWRALDGALQATSYIYFETAVR